MENSEQPAFPIGFDIGLTKREYIAAMVLQGIAASSSSWGNMDAKKYAETSLLLTDALLSELSKNVPA